MEVTSKRRMSEAGQKVATRLLYILKNEFVAALEDIIMLLPRYQANLKTMKDNGYEIVGYARKSIGEKDDMKRVRLLNLMIKKLKTRSLVDKVFVSPKSSAGDPFDKRDEKKQVELMSVINSDGDTQDMLKYINDKNKKIVLVAIDFAGLTTNCQGLKSFLSIYSNSKEVAIDYISSKNEVKMYTSGELLNDEKKVKEFECRKSIIQRSN
ncbi:hypothetical protein G6F46_008295 [Rhizopus delemar]|nr:hypothetical protein G6F46_008295 [Rhizopus delemar]